MGVFQSVKGRYFLEVGVLSLTSEFFLLFLASSCGKWCHHLSLGCGYLSMSCGHDPSGKNHKGKQNTEALGKIPNPSCTHHRHSDLISKLCKVYCNVICFVKIVPRGPIVA